MLPFIKEMKNVPMWFVVGASVVVVFLLGSNYAKRNYNLEIDKN
mgnify:CR=1|jgi:hypothetical protein